MKYLFSRIIYLLFSPVFVIGQNVVPITATESYNGQFAYGTLSVRYVLPGTMRKPLLVVEGFDPGHILKPEEQFGETSIKSFISDLSDDGTTALKTALVDIPQYDIVYLDWNNGTDYIQRNALLVEEAIRWINSQKILAGSTEPNVVIGQSMGGVVARYALKDMENKGQNHQTRLFISHDAPQQGANVPQGYQHLARHARDLYIKSGITAATIEFIQIIEGNAFSPLRALSIANEPAANIFAPIDKIQMSSGLLQDKEMKFSFCTKYKYLKEEHRV
jgi:PGAP1-like protein